MTKPPTPEESRAMFARHIDYLRDLAAVLDLAADDAPTSPRLYLRRAVGYLANARGFVEIAASFIDEPAKEGASADTNHPASPCRGCGCGVAKCGEHKRAGATACCPECDHS